MSHEDEFLLVLQLAKAFPALRAFLDRVLADRVLAGVFLLHRDELFQRQYLTESGLTFSFGTTGLPLMSHRVEELRVSLERHAAKVAVHAPRWADAEVERLQAEFHAATGERPIDAAVVAILNTIRTNEDLRNLVSSDEPVTRSKLRASIRTYDALHTESTQEDWVGAASTLLGGHAGRAVRELFLHADLLKSVIDVERFRLSLLERAVDHWERLLACRNVKDADWRRVILNLHQQGLVEHAGPLCFWCNRCPETGVTGSLATSFVLHPVYCPRCRRPAYAATTFVPIPPLQRALELKDGLLGAVIAHWLETRTIGFQASQEASGQEIDFLIPLQDEVALVECKMNHVLDRKDLTRKLYDNRNQLRDHILAAVRSGRRVRAAACIVNITARELEGFAATMVPESEPLFTAIGGKLLSYEHASDWLKQFAVSR